MPLSCIKFTLLVSWNIRNNSQLVITSREDHLTNVARTSLALLLSRNWLRVHGGNAMIHQVQISLRLVNRCAEVLQAAHVSCTLNLDSSLPSFFDNFLQIFLLVWSEISFGDVSRGRLSWGLCGHLCRRLCGRLSGRLCLIISRVVIREESLLLQDGDGFCNAGFLHLQWKFVGVSVSCDEPPSVEIRATVSELTLEN